MQFREDDEMSTAPDTNDTAQASDTCAPAKRPGRPRTAEQPLTPAQRQKLYKQRKQAQAEQLQRAAQDVGALANDAAEAAQAALVALPKEVLLKALQDCLDVLESDNTDLHDWRRSMARRIFVTLTQKYDLNREDDENQESSTTSAKSCTTS